MNKDQNLINEFAIKTLKENLNVMYAQIWREGQLTAEYKRMPVKTRLNTWSACKGVVSCAAGIALDEGLIRLDEKIVDIFPEYAPENPEGYLGDVTLENMLTLRCFLVFNILFYCFQRSTAHRRYKIAVCPESRHFRFKIGKFLS